MSTTHVPAGLAGQDLEQRSVNAVRVLAMDAVQQANSGHPGTPMGLADAAYVLWSRFLRFDPAAPDWPDRDRFVLSAGHACMLQYAMLHLLGYDLSLDDLKAFRQWGSRTPGHPEQGVTPGVETTTGPLGQGISTAVGMALAERHLAARLNREGRTVVDHRTWVMASDGDMMEGVQAEAASAAGHLGLGKLNVLYDDNRITIDGETALAFSEDVGKRYAAYGWHVLAADGHDRAAVQAALEAARDETARPSLVVLRTHIALGAPHKQDTAGAHGSPLGPDEVAATKAVYGWPAEPAFFVPEDVREHYRELGRRCRGEREAWETAFADFRRRDPDGAALWDTLHDPELPADTDRPRYEPGTAEATRKASHAALAWLVPRVPALVGGSADLTPSNLTQAGDAPAVSRENPGGQYVHYGIREHAMAAIMNGMARHGGLLPYGGTFLVFSDYMRPAVRLAALMNTRVIYVFTHDSIFLGEDGPTHQPIACLAALRALPNMTVIRPADANETVLAWETAIRRKSPVALVLTRQKVPVLEPPAGDGDLRRGAYILFEPPGKPELIAFATGSEVAVTLEAARGLAAEGARVRVVAVPSWELFAEQDADYRERVLAPGITNRMAVEAASPFGWERFVGAEGEVVGMDRFGASAPATVLQEKFGFTAGAVEAVMRRRLGR